MLKYSTVTWTKFDSGQEVLWLGPAWLGTLQIINNHIGESVYNSSSPVYSDLAAAFPDIAWSSIENNGSFRPLFRDSTKPWTRTKVLASQLTHFDLTPLGKDLLSGKVKDSDIFLSALREHTENAEYPFQILASAFLAAGANLSFDLQQVYYGIMQGYRPGDNLRQSLQDAVGYQLPPSGDTSVRRLKLMLNLMVRAGVISEYNRWFARDVMRLKLLSAPISASLPINFDRIAIQAQSDFTSANLVYAPEVVRRFVAALLAKPFVILTGLSGSGKTKLAQAFASWISSSANCYTIVSVGADWTGTDHIIGYPDALDQNNYVRTKALDIILEAYRSANNLAASPEPYFLILDEMNLSHVERYFADILSSIESKGKLEFFSGTSARNGVPPSISQLPPNLFIIGTVNVDETTYMFSPKVLDRANVIEFRVSASEMQQYLNQASSQVNLGLIAGTGQSFSPDLAAKAASPAALAVPEKKLLEFELMLIFSALSKSGAEFGFRTSSEIERFVFFHEVLAGKQLTQLEKEQQFREAIDAQIFQKILPKLHGSRKKLEPLLWSLAAICFHMHSWSPQGTLTVQEIDSSGNKVVSNLDLRNEIEKAFQLKIERDPFAKSAQGAFVYPEALAFYKLSYSKILRMINLLDQGFASFAEA